MASQINLKNYMYQRKGSPKATSKNSLEKTVEIQENSDTEGVSEPSVIDVFAKGTPKDSEILGHAGPASTATKAGQKANFGPGWSPDMLASFMEQQQTLLANMAAFLPSKGNSNQGDHVLREDSSPPTKKSWQGDQQGYRSEGELSDHEDSIADRDFNAFVNSDHSGDESDPYADISAFFVDEDKLGKSSGS